MRVKPFAAIFRNPIDTWRTPEHWAADVKEHLDGGHDVTICSARGRDPWMQIPGRFHFQERL